MGFPKSYIIDYPDLMKEWDYEENNKKGLNPSKVTGQSHDYASWICSVCGSKWEAEVGGRVRGNGCRICGKKKQKQTLINNLLKKKGSLQDNNPELAAEWHPTRNYPLTPKDVLANSGTSVTWKCKKCGHEWPEKINVRNRGCGCPVCANKVIVPGINDLATTNPWLAEEWHPTENGDKTPMQFCAGSHEPIVWKCRICGHEWTASIGSRNSGKGCSKCFYNEQISFQEKALFYYIKKQFRGAVEGYRPDWLNKRELDIYLPEHRIGIEYDGERWHKDARKDEEKDDLCLERGVEVIHIREPLCPYAQLENAILLKNRSTTCLEEAINCLIDLLCQKTNVKRNKTKIQIVKDTISILKQAQINIKKKSLADKYPNIAKEWDYEINAPLIPEQFSGSSGRTVYWRCTGHSYPARIADKTRKQGSRCPYCSGKKVLLGFNDLASKRPDIAAQWHPTLNALKPTEVTISSNKDIYWQCEKGHVWNAKVNNRTNGRKCPYCTNRKVLKGYNDLESHNQLVAMQWYQPLNGDKHPDEVLFSSSAKYYWRCEKCGHIWQREIRLRAKGSKCPRCKQKP